VSGRRKPAVSGRRNPAAGFSLVELALAIGLAALLGGLGAALAPQGNPGLAAAGGELRAAVEQAFLLARARSGPVRLALGGHTPACARTCAGPGDGLEVLPLVLPRGVRWGVPDPGMPMPEGMARPRQAHLTGAAHPCISVTPRRTALAGVWFLTDGRDAVCLRLAGTGELQLLRWRRRTRQWRRC